MAFRAGVPADPPCQPAAVHLSFRPLIELAWRDRMKPFDTPQVGVRYHYNPAAAYLDSVQVEVG